MSRSPLPQRVLETIRRHNMIAAGDRLPVAVSGGPDSTALLHVLASLQPSLCCAGITVLHFDHRLRGDDSDADREFVRSLADTYNFPFHSRSVDVRAFQAEHRGLSLEMAARTCRHEFFRSAMRNLNARIIALGHTASDQAEELLLRLIRGTGPSGLAGMQPRTRNGIIRPLLFATRSDILDYLRERNLPYREDATNQDPSCQRNAVRLKAIPLLAEIFHPRIAATLSRHASLAADEEDYWRQLLEETWDTACIGAEKSRLTLSLPNLLSHHPAMQRRLLRYAVERLQGHTLGLFAAHVELLLCWIAESVPGKSLHLPKGLRATLGTDSLVLSMDTRTAARPRGSASEPSPRLGEIHPRQTSLQGFPSATGEKDGPTVAGAPAAAAPSPITISLPGRHSFGLFLFSVREFDRIDLEENPPPNSLSPTAWMDAGKIQWPMTFRLWRPGDRFQPSGLGGSKKLQDFFTDAKVPRELRHTIPILCDLEKICWIAGFRLDDRVKVDAGTDRVLVVELSTTA